MGKCLSCYACWCQDDDLPPHRPKTAKKSALRETVVTVIDHNESNLDQDEDPNTISNTERGNQTRLPSPEKPSKAIRSRSVELPHRGRQQLKVSVKGWKLQCEELTKDLERIAKICEDSDEFDSITSAATCNETEENWW